MPNPKRRHSNHRTRIRRAHDAIRALAAQHCGRCGAVVRAHRVCENCGHYALVRKGNEKDKPLEVFERTGF
jgi:large subunit ribosomal protein L32